MYILKRNSCDGQYYISTNSWKTGQKLKIAEWRMSFRIFDIQVFISSTNNQLREIVYLILSFVNFEFLFGWTDILVRWNEPGNKLMVAYGTLCLE